MFSITQTAAGSSVFWRTLAFCSQCSVSHCMVPLDLGFQSGLSVSVPGKIKKSQSRTDTQCQLASRHCRSLQNSCNSYQFTQALLIILQWALRTPQGGHYCRQCPPSRAPEPFWKGLKSPEGGRGRRAFGILQSSQPGLSFPASLHSRFCLKKQ